MITNAIIIIGLTFCFWQLSKNVMVAVGATMVMYWVIFYLSQILTGA